MEFTQVTEIRVLYNGCSASSSSFSEDKKTQYSTQFPKMISLMICYVDLCVNGGGIGMKSLY